MIDQHAALIYAMVMTSAADRDMTDSELKTIGDIVRALPAFEGFREERLVTIASDCADKLSLGDGGFEIILEEIVEALPAPLRETAYAIACDVAAADGVVSQEELEILEQLRHRLPVGRLPAAAIERGARARYTRG